MRAIRAKPVRSRGGSRPGPAWWALAVLLVTVSCSGPEEDASSLPNTIPSIADTTGPSVSAVTPSSTEPPTPTTETVDAVTTTAPAVPEFHLSPDGVDGAEGTEQEPWATLSYALSRLQAGETLVVHGGEYREQVKVDVAAGTADQPVVVRAASGEEPVLRGLLWLRHLDHWTIDGLNITWDEEENEDDDHMVKLTDGDAWELRNAEIWGARSFAAVLVTGTTDEAPSGWRVASNCIHDTIPTNGRNEDQLLYVNTGTSPTDGLIENNLLFGAENGSGIKLGGPSRNEGGARGVTVRRNTILDAAQGILVGWQSSDNVITGNFFAGTAEGYGHIRGFELDGSGNVAYGNGGDDHEPFILNDEGFEAVEDGGGNQTRVDVELPGTPSCAFHPGGPDYGLETALDPMPSS